MSNAIDFPCATTEALPDSPPVVVQDILPPYFPGTLHGVDIDQYHAMVGISKTGLDEIERSGAHYFGNRLHPNRPPPKERAGQLEGTLAHCAVLEPEEFGKRYVITPSDAPRCPSEAQWNAKNPSPQSVASMAWWKDFTQTHGSKRLITAAQYDTAMRQADSVRALPEIAEALSRGTPEVSAFWVDPETGEPCRCRPDWVAKYSGNGVVLLDLKTFNDASAGEFRRQVHRKRYHVQDPFYSDGHELATGLQTLGFIFVVVETEWPYAANALMLGERSRRQGRSDYRRNLDTYAACRRSGVWPGYGSHIQLIDLPGYAFTDQELTA